MWARLRPQGAVTWFLNGGVRFCGAGQSYAKLPTEAFCFVGRIIPIGRNHFPVVFSHGSPGRWDAAVSRRMTVCAQGRVAAARQRSSSSPVHGSVPQTLMDILQAAGEGSRQRSDVGFQSRVAAVSFPAGPGTRLTLPGVMDDEGRVDESRLRMHIFKNGILRGGEWANAHFSLHLQHFLIFCMAALNTFNL